jgi:hypothetical protein
LPFNGLHGVIPEDITLPQYKLEALLPKPTCCVVCKYTYIKHQERIFETMTSQQTISLAEMLLHVTINMTILLDVHRI